MSHSVVFCPVVAGSGARILRIEAALGRGFSGLQLLGIPGEAARQLRERVRSALEAAGAQVSSRRLVVQVGPLESVRQLRSPWERLDFPVAAAIALAMRKKDPVPAGVWLLAGELSIAGEIRPSEGDAAWAWALREGEWRLHGGGKAFPLLSDWLSACNSAEAPAKTSLDAVAEELCERSECQRKRIQRLCDVLLELKLRPELVLAMALCAIARRPLLLVGPPGVGKSYALHRFPFFLRALTPLERMELRLLEGAPLAGWDPPVRRPHHSASMASLTGGASLRPGELSLAHGGGLLLDELIEFDRDALDALREPLDAQRIRLSRTGGQVEYPAGFILGMASNPCSCGHFHSRKHGCRCNRSQLQRGLGKLTGPLADRCLVQRWVSDEEPDSLHKSPLVRCLDPLWDLGEVGAVARGRFAEQIFRLQEREASLDPGPMAFEEGNVGAGVCVGEGLRAQSLVWELQRAAQLLLVEGGWLEVDTFERERAGLERLRDLRLRIQKSV